MYLPAAIAVFTFSTTDSEPAGGTPSGWVGFEAARPMTNTATFSEIVPASGDLYANPAASQQMLDDQFEASKLIFGGRRLSPYLRPHFVMESDWVMIKDQCETIFGALQKVKEAAIADEAILDELGLTDVERELVRIDPKYAHVSPTSRLDSFLVDDTYSFVELNGESPAGIAFSDSASEIFRSLPVMQKFLQRYNVQTLEGSSKLLDVLIACYTEFCGGTMARNPVIAIVDLKDLPTIK